MTLKIQQTDLFQNLKNNEVVINKEIKHIFHKDDLLAIWAAYQAERPLLLRGKPGTGKSQLAKAIAQLLDWEIVTEVMHGGTQLEDLHWHYDAITRLGEAQSLAYTLGLEKKDSNSKQISVKETLDHKHFIRPGVFWWAFDWVSAKQSSFDSSETVNEAPKGVVLLIDEIDKAEPDLPNGLLQTLGDLEFKVPYLNKNIKALLNSKWVSNFHLF